MSEEEIGFITQFFALNGYAIVERGKEKIVIEKGGFRFRIDLITEANRGKLYELIRSSGNELYFVCSSEKVKACAIQQAAKFSFDHKGMDLTIYIASLEELKNGKNLRKIEFMPER